MEQPPFVMVVTVQDLPAGLMASMISLQNRNGIILLADMLLRSLLLFALLPMGARWRLMPTNEMSHQHQRVKSWAGFCLMLQPLYISLFSISDVWASLVDIPRSITHFR